VSRRALAVVDYGAGNLRSVQNALAHLGADHFVTSDPSDLDSADSLIFPGVGEAASAMSVLRRTGLEAAIRRFVASGRKTLGICIGCQVVFDRSEEGNTECLGILRGTVRRFPREPGLKVPHMGWNQVRFLVQHPVFEGSTQGSSFYFVHSYYPAPADRRHVAAECEYGITFSAAVAAGSFIAFQFHLEKSGTAGLGLLSAFLRWDGRWAGAPPAEGRDGQGERGRA
jgi:imidazole glycerol-phosphate synthase subunit HisH